MSDPEVNSLHHGQPVRAAGVPLDRARAAMLMVHGRGARAEDILSLAEQFGHPEFAYLAPQAASNTWYPNRFLVPLAENEPWLSSALSFVAMSCNKSARLEFPVNAFCSWDFRRVPALHWNLPLETPSVLVVLWG